jgi:hypothetical protein
MRPQIHAQFCKSGGSGDGGDIFRLYLAQSYKQAEATVE